MIDVTNAGTINALLQYTPDLIVNWIEVWTVGRPQLRGYEVGCLPGQQSNGLTCSMRRGTVLLECEVAARHLLDGRKQMLSEQHIAIVRSIHLRTRLNEDQISAPGPSNSGVHVYGRVSVNKEDILNTSCS